MGHGASTNVKTVTINSQDGHEHKYLSGWTRSNSDGCIVETSLNSSKTKIELLDQQRTELKELLDTAEERLKKSDNKHSEIEKQMAEVEGTNFELRDNVLELEQIVESLQTQLAQNQEQDLTGTLEAKDLYIEQLQLEANNYQKQMDKLKVKYRKRLNSLKTQLAEVKQEGSLNLYKLKQEMVLLEEENYKLTAKLDRASSASKSKQHKNENMNNGDDEAAITDWEDSRTKVILQLSTQLSVQQEKIEELQTILEEKERLIKEHTKYSQHKPDHLRDISGGKVLNGKKKSADMDTNQNVFTQRWKSSSKTDIISADGVFTQRWQSSSETDIIADSDIEPVKKDSGHEAVGNIRTTSATSSGFSDNIRATSATSITSAFSDTSIPDDTARRRRRRRKQNKESTSQMSDEI